MGPISLIVTALAVGAAAGLKPTATKAVKDAYAGVKKLIQDRYAAAHDSVENLEKAPDKQPRRDYTQAELEAAGAATDTELMQQAQALIELVKIHDPDAARTIGLDLTRFTATQLSAKDITAESDTGPVTGVSAVDAKIDGAATFENVQARSGTTPPKSEGQ